MINHVMLPAALHAVTDIYRLAMGQEPEWEKEGWHMSLLKDMFFGQASKVFVLGTIANVFFEAATTGKISSGGTDLLPVEGLVRLGGRIARTGYDIVTETKNGITARDFAEGFDYEKICKDLEGVIRSTSVTRTPYDILRRVTGNSDADKKKRRGR